MRTDPSRGSYRDVIAWQKGVELCLEIYSVTKAFPTSERFGLTGELRKTARSIVCNIAEGHRRRSATEFARFLDIARGSQAEVDTQLFLAMRLGYLEGQPLSEILELCDEVGALIYSLASAIRRSG